MGRCFCALKHSKPFGAVLKKSEKRCAITIVTKKTVDSTVISVDFPVFFQKCPPWANRSNRFSIDWVPGAAFQRFLVPGVALGLHSGPSWPHLGFSWPPLGLYGRSLIPLGTSRGRPGNTPERHWAPPGGISDSLWALTGSLAPPVIRIEPTCWHRLCDACWFVTNRSGHY